jgi:SAM-dependent methyltransferase
MSEQNPAEFWEERYSGSDRVWSGRPNRVLVDVASGWEPGRALDLGCGEGADAIWLAERGWRATGIDISSAAIRRATDAAASAGVPSDRIRFIAADLGSWVGQEEYDLVTASFLHSPVELTRSRILRHASTLVAPGGHLLIVSHAAFPPWSKANDEHEHHFPSPQEELDDLELDPANWSVELCETRAREATGPDGEHATLEDGVVLVRRNVR